MPRDPPTVERICSSKYETGFSDVAIRFQTWTVQSNKFDDDHDS